jgi:hypothetical protein
MSTLESNATCSSSFIVGKGITYIYYPYVTIPKHPWDKSRVEGDGRLRRRSGDGGSTGVKSVPSNYAA